MPNDTSIDGDAPEGLPLANVLSHRDRRRCTGPRDSECRRRVNRSRTHGPLDFSASAVLRAPMEHGRSTLDSSSTGRRQQTARQRGGGGGDDQSNSEVTQASGQVVVPELNAGITIYQAQYDVLGNRPVAAQAIPPCTCDTLSGCRPTTVSGNLGTQSRLAGQPGSLAASFRGTDSPCPGTSKIPTARHVSLLEGALRPAQAAEWYGNGQPAASPAKAAVLS